MEKEFVRPLKGVIDVSFRTIREGFQEKKIETNFGGERGNERYGYDCRIDRRN
jgi:hypothetical protein